MSVELIMRSGDFVTILGPCICCDNSTKLGVVATENLVKKIATLFDNVSYQELRISLFNWLFIIRVNIIS